MNLFFRPLISAKTGKAISVGDGQSYLHQAVVDAMDFHQHWLFTNDGQNRELQQDLGNNLILNRTSSYAIDVVGGVFDDQKSLQTYPVSANANQLWEWNDGPAGSGNHIIQCHGQAFVVDIPNGDPGADLQIYHPNGGTNQLWTSPGILRQLISVYKISCVASAPKVLDVPNGAQNPGLVIQQFTNPGLGCFNQYWRLWPRDRAQGVSIDDVNQVNSGTPVRIQSVCNGLFLQSQPVVDNQAWVMQAADSDGDDQVWNMIGDNVAGWKLQSFLNPGLVLDLPNGDPSDHVDIQVYRDNGGNNNQLWLFG